MPLLEQVIPVSFDGGLDTKTDEKLVLPSKLLTLENGIFTRGRRISKRYGYSVLPKVLAGGGFPNTGEALGTFQNELLQFGAGQACSYSPGMGAWVGKGAVVPCAVANRTAIRNTAQQTMPDGATAAGITLYVWEDSRGGVRATALDASTGQAVLSDASLNATATTPRVIALGQQIAVLYANSGNLLCRIFTPATLTFGSETTLTNDVNGGNPWFDVAPWGVNAVVAWNNTVPNVKVAFLLPSGVLGSPITGVASPVSVAVAADNAIGVIGSQAHGYIFVACHNNAAGTQGFTLNSDLTLQQGVTTFEAVTSPVTRNLAGLVLPSGTQVKWFYEVNASVSYNHLLKTVTFNTAGVVGTPTVLARSVGLACKPFTVGGVNYVGAAYDTALNPCYFLLSDAGVVAARVLTLNGGGLSAKPGVPQSNVSGSAVTVPLLQRGLLTTQTGQLLALKGVSEYTFDFGSSSRYQSAVLGKGLFVAGGFLAQYDGTALVEAGFHYPPENVGYTPATTGGHLADGDYFYSVMWEWVDNQGQTHRSIPSLATKATVSGGGGNGSVALVIPTLRITAKQAPLTQVSVVVYRSTLAAPTILQRVTSVSSPKLNDPTSDTVSFTDTLADASLAGAEILYTTGGVVEDDAPPACSLIATSKNRVFLAGTENPGAIWYSKLFTPGVAPAFSAGFVMQLPVDQISAQAEGRETALAMLDGNLVIFKRTRIYVVTGDGPLDTGQDQQFALPQLVTTDVGCSNPRSIVTTPDGLMFQSLKGLYLLAHDLTVQYIGAPVEVYNGLTVTSARLMEAVNQVRFTTAGGPTLVYDYYFGQWSTFTNQPALDAANWAGSYVYLRADGSVWQQTPAAYLDNGAAIRLRFRTAWLHIGALQGFQRVKRAMILGNFVSPHSLQWNVYADYEPYWIQGVTLNPNAIVNTSTWGDGATWGAAPEWGGVQDNVYQFELYLKRQKTQAVSFEFQDINPGASGEAFNLSNLALLAAGKAGLFKVQRTKKVG